MNPFEALDRYRDRVQSAQAIIHTLPDDPALLVPWMRTRFSLKIDDIAAMLGKSRATVTRWGTYGPTDAAISHLHLLARHLMAIEAQIETPDDATHF